MRDGVAKTNGIDLDKRAAAAILAKRARDGSQHIEARVSVDYVPGSAPGIWRQDPLSLIPLAVGSQWSGVTPFVIPTAAAFRALAPPALRSAAYKVAYDEVKRLGGDGGRFITPTAAPSPLRRTNTTAKRATAAARCGP